VGYTRKSTQLSAIDVLKQDRCYLVGLACLVSRLSNNMRRRRRR
jgi:hypothetical protein